MMKAAVLFQVRDIRIVDLDIPKISENDVLIKVRAAGICNTDLVRAMKIGAHKMPIVLGHEISGEVVEVGDAVTNISTGDRVAVNPLIPCMKCEYCYSGLYNLCDNYSFLGSRENGGFAEYIRVPATNVIKLENIEYESMALIEPCVCALHAIKRGEIGIGSTIAIFGVGTIGLFALQWAKYIGSSKVFVIDIYDEKLKIAEKLGADVCINASDVDPVKEILQLTQKGVDSAIESAGTIETIINCIKVVRKGGTVSLMGIPYSSSTLLDWKIYDKILRGELTLKGSWMYDISPFSNEWKVAANAIINSIIKTRPLITHYFKLDLLSEVLNKMFTKQLEPYIKVIIQP